MLSRPDRTTDPSHRGRRPPFDGDDESDRPQEIDGYFAAWPVRTDGRLGIWRKEAAALMPLVEKGYAYATGPDERRGTWTIKYLMTGAVRDIDAGLIPVEQSGTGGEVVPSVGDAVPTSGRPSGAIAKTVWNRPSHNAGTHGSALLRALVPGRHFPFPKALYAVEDAIRIVVKDNPEAVVLDFFGGSGTTTHAVARLNRQDGGRRQSILVTNNEVSAEEAEALRKAGHRPGDAEWELLGIFEHVTRPRITAAITGRTPEGQPIKGEYKFTDEFPMADGFDENVQFFELTYLDPEDVELGEAFSAIAPLVWLRAGGRGPIIGGCLDSDGNQKPYAWAGDYGVLFNPDRWRAFVQEQLEPASAAFIVTDSPTIFSGIASELPRRLDIVRLYENYLNTFAINQGRA